MLARETQAPRRAETQAGPTHVVPVAPDLRVGTRLAGYDIQAVAGRGGMGVVYRAEHLHLGRVVALKLLVADRGDADDFRERFLRESRMAAAISHPHIVTVYDAGEADGMLFIAMQYVEGTDLGKLLRRAGPLEPSEAVFLLSQVASALDAAHAHGMVHRDVKPENVLISGERCYLTDFGATKRTTSHSSLTAHGQFVGTIDYMAPEQIKGGDLTGRTDVYALGCLLFHTLTNTVPFDRDSEIATVYAHLDDAPPMVSSREADLPPELDTVIARAMAKEPGDRFPTCSAFLAAVEAAAGGEPDVPVPAGLSRVARTKILIADGEESSAAQLRAALAGGQFSISEARDADTAGAIASRERPALVFVDWHMDGDAGEAITRALRAADTTADARIIAVTRRADSRQRGVFAAAGADDVLVKPFSPLQVLYKVRDQLGPEALAY